MAKIKLSDIDFGLNSKPEIDVKHDSKTLLETAFDKEQGDYADIPIDKIIKNPNNDYAENDTDEGIAELASDIKHNGLLHNIVVFGKVDGNYLLLSGERRLKAYEYLFETEKDNKYSVIHAKILKNLTDTEQMIILDAANLHTRGGIGGETRFRKAMVRFVKNLQAAEQITETEAKKMTAETFESIDKRLIDNNLTIEENLIPELLTLLDKDLIPKRQAVLYARLPIDTQSEIAAAVNEANEKGRGELKAVNDRLKEAMKQTADLTARIESGEKGIIEVNSELAEITAEVEALEQLKKKGVNGQEIALKRDELANRVRTLESEKKRYTAAINEAKAVLNDNREKITKKPQSADDAVAVMVNKNINKVVSSVNAVTSINNIRRINAMDEIGKKVVTERLTEAKKQLEKAIKEIGQGLK